MFSWCEPVVEACFFRQDADRGSDCLRFLYQVVTSNTRSPTTWSEDCAEQTHRSGLTSAIRAKETKDLAVLHIEADLINRGEVSELFR